MKGIDLGGVKGKGGQDRHETDGFSEQKTYSKVKASDLFVLFLVKGR